MKRNKLQFIDEDDDDEGHADIDDEVSLMKVAPLLLSIYSVAKQAWAPAPFKSPWS